MNISEKIEAINNKIEQNKYQYDLDRQIAKIKALSLGNVSKYEFLTGKDLLPEKELLEKAAAMKRLEYSSLGKELKKQTSVAEKLQQEFYNASESNKKEEDKAKNKRSRAKLNIVYDNYFTLYKYHNIKEFTKCSLDSKLNDLKQFKDKLKLFYHYNIELKPNNGDQKKGLKKEKQCLIQLMNYVISFWIYMKLNMINLQKLRRKG